MNNRSNNRIGYSRDKRMVLCPHLSLRPSSEDVMGYVEKLRNRQKEKLPPSYFGREILNHFEEKVEADFSDMEDYVPPFYSKKKKSEPNSILKAGLALVEILRKEKAGLV